MNESGEDKDVKSAIDHFQPEKKINKAPRKKKERSAFYKEQDNQNFDMSLNMQVLAETKQEYAKYTEKMKDE